MSSEMANGEAAAIESRGMPIPAPDAATETAIEPATEITPATEVVIAPAPEAAIVPATEVVLDLVTDRPAADPRYRHGGLFAALLGLLVLGGSLLLLINLDQLGEDVRLDRQMPIASLQVSAAFYVTCGGGMLMSGLVLLGATRRRGLAIAIGVLLATIATLGVLTIREMMRRDFYHWPELTIRGFLQLGPVAATGIIAFLLTAPRMETLYRRAATGAGDSAVSPRRPGLARSWLLLLLLYVTLMPLAWCWHRIAEQPWLQANRKFVTYFLLLERPFFAEFIFAACCLGLGALLVWRRRWSSIRFTILFLWAAPLLGVVWHVIADRPALDGSIPLAVSPADFGLDWFTALAWTCYMLESPQVHRLYPGSRRYRDLVTDVDVF